MQIITHISIYNHYILLGMYAVGLIMHAVDVQFYKVAYNLPRVSARSCYQGPAEALSLGAIQVARRSCLCCVRSSLLEGAFGYTSSYCSPLMVRKHPRDRLDCNLVRFFGS
jgi:hypothetical protein